MSKLPSCLVAPGHLVGDFESLNVVLEGQNFIIFCFLEIYRQTDKISTPELRRQKRLITWWSKKTYVHMVRSLRLS